MKKKVIMMALLLIAGTAAFAQEQNKTTPHNNGDKGKQEVRLANNKHPDLMKDSKAPDSTSKTKSAKEQGGGQPSGQRMHKPY